MKNSVILIHHLVDESIWNDINFIILQNSNNYNRVLHNMKERHFDPSADGEKSG